MREREREKELDEKERAKEKEKEKEKKEKEKQKKEDQKEKEKRVKEKEKEKEKSQKEKEKQEKQKAMKQKEKEEEQVKPKRARNSFAFFYSANFQSSKKANPDARVTEIVKLLSQKWKSMSDSQKQPYVEKANIDHERSQKEKAEYLKSLPPKRPLAPYMLFSQEVRDSVTKSNPNASTIEIGKLLGEKWRNLSDSQKEKYRRLSEQARGEWRKQMEHFKANE